MSKNIRKRRERLWAENDAKCYWCGVLTVLPPRGSTKIEHRDDLATLDHLRTRLDGNRQDPNNSNEERTCLACWACNNRRGSLSQISASSSRYTLKVNESDFRYVGESFTNEEECILKTSQDSPSDS